MKLSIVTTLYNSSPYIEEFYERMTKSAQKITDDYEIIFVDDGSPDDSLQKILRLFKSDRKIKVIELSRNFGHHKAIMTGLSHAQGEFVFLIDVDLEEKPELLNLFWEEMEKLEDIDVIYGIQKRRKGGWFERITGKWFWTILNALSDIEIPSNMITARLTTKKYNDALTKYRETELFLGGVWPHAGFRQKAVPVQKGSWGRSSYTLRRKMRLMLNAITSFSNKPLIYIFNIGILITAGSILFIIKIIYDKIFYNITIDGWSSLIVSIWFFGGLIISILGVIGIYLSKIFSETKRRPYTLIRNMYKHDGESE
jgi:putative glycosyltransferase